MADSNGGGGRENNPGNFANDREKASEAGRKGGQKAAATSRTIPNARRRPDPRAAVQAMAAAAAAVSKVADTSSDRFRAAVARTIAARLPTFPTPYT